MVDKQREGSEEPQQNPETLLKAHKEQVTTIAWNGEGDKLLTGSTDHCLKIWRLETLKEETELKGHKGRVNQVYWCPTDPYSIASVSSDGSLRVWDTRSAKMVHIVAVEADPFLVAWCPDGSSICVGNTREKLSFVDTKKYQVFTTRENSQQLFDIAWNNTGSHFMYALKDTIKRLVWSTMEETNAAQIQGKARCIAAHPSMENVFAVGSSDTYVSFWEANDMICTGGCSSLDSEVRSISYNGCGSRLAVGGRSGDVHLLGGTRNEIQQRMQVQGRTSSSFVAWNPKKDILAHTGKQTGFQGGYRGIVRFYDASV